MSDGFSKMYFCCVWTLNRHQYEQFCTAEAANLPVFYQPWWLDAVCGQGYWLPFIQGEFNAIWPVFVKKKGFLRKVTMPVLTPRLGPWSGKTMPQPVDVQFVLHKTWAALAFVQHIDGQVRDYSWLKDAGFDLQEFNRYVITPGIDAVHFFETMSTMSKRHIQKASTGLSCSPLTNMRVLDGLITQSLSRHNAKNPIPLNSLTTLHQALAERSQGIAWMAEDQETRIHAAVLLAWDNQTVYYLAGGLDDRIPQIGASRFLLWKGIEMALAAGKNFDFGGGFIPGVDAVYLSMGGKPVPYIRAERRIFGL